MPLCWGPGTPFLFPKAWIPSRAELHGIIHSTPLLPKGGGTICDRSSQPKLPQLELGILCMRGEGTALHSITEGTFCQWNACARTPPMCFCSCALPSSVMLYTNHSDCSQPLPAFATNISLLIPQVYTGTAAPSHGRGRVVTEHKSRSTVAFLMFLQLEQPKWKQEKHPNACSRAPCTQILLPPLQLGGVRSSGLGQT